MPGTFETLQALDTVNRTARRVAGPAQQIDRKQVGLVLLGTGPTAVPEIIRDRLQQGSRQRTLHDGLADGIRVAQYERAAAPTFLAFQATQGNRQIDCIHRSIQQLLLLVEEVFAVQVPQ
ncbi:hypothetical protein D9M68_796120 [compost metagenome]